MEIVADKPETRGVEALRNATAGGKKFGSDGDFINTLLAKYTTEKDGKAKTIKETKDGVTTEKTIPGKKIKGVDVDGLKALAAENGKTVKVYPNAGMYRMNIGNMLRAAAKKRGGLIVKGRWTPADEAFLGKGFVATETRKGEKIAVKKEEKAKAA